MDDLGAPGGDAGAVPRPRVEDEDVAAAAAARGKEATVGLTGAFFRRRDA